MRARRRCTSIARVRPAAVTEVIFAAHHIFHILSAYHGLMKNGIALWRIAFLSLAILAPALICAQESGEGARKVTSQVNPQYPSLARTMNIQGTVRADVVVAPNGKVKSIEVKGGHPLLVQVSEDALRQWRWEPGPRETHEIVELRFKP